MKRKKKDKITKFSIDYCKRGTAKCRVCKKKISKDELRIGMLVPFKSTYYTQYRHVICAFRAFHKARLESNIITGTKGIEGFEKIMAEDQVFITELIINENAVRKQLPKNPVRIKKRQNPVSEEKERRKLRPSNLPTIPVLFTNADQLTGIKLTELQNHIKREKPLIIGICEIKPKNSRDYSEEDYRIDGYNLHPVNLDTKSGRGIAVYTHESIEKSVMELTPIIKFEEICLLELRLRGGDKLLFGCTYRSPTDCNTSSENNDLLNELLEEVCDGKYTHVCVVGDFNFRDINWINQSTNHNDGSKEAKFINTIQNCFLHQHVDRPTRRRGNDDPSQLDLIYLLTKRCKSQILDIMHLLGKATMTLSPPP